MYGIKIALIALLIVYSTVIILVIMSHVYEYNPTIEITRSLYIINVTKTLKSKCHKQKGYPFVYKQAEQCM